jgi:hypothetical protein
MKTVDKLFAQLQVLGAGEVGHVNGSLVAHLRGTEKMLRDWGACEPLCVAGLYHAVYGTDGYKLTLASLSERKDIAGIIGIEAEELVYLYGACDRKVFYRRIGTKAQLRFADRFRKSEYNIQTQQLTQLCELIFANELEIVSNSVEIRAKHGAALSRLFERMSGLVSQSAFQAYRRILC